MPKKGKRPETPPQEDAAEDPLKVKRTLTQVDDFEEVRYIRTEKFYSHAELEELAVLKKKPNKFYEMPVRGLGIRATKFSSTGIPSVDAETVQDLVAGRLESELAGRRDEEFVQGLKRALECWLEMKRIETLMTTFISSLIQAVDPKGREYIYCVCACHPVPIYK